MQSNRGRDTEPELTVRKAIWSTGYRGYKTSWRKAPGRPDIAFVGKKVAVIVHGCFWHGCRKCMKRTPKTNKKYWSWKFETNRKRDARDLRRLKNEGWKTFVIWEHDVKKGNLKELLAWLRTKKLTKLKAS